MAKRNSTEDKLTALRALESAPLSGEGEKLLREALASRNRELVARGASVARELELNRFCGEMAEAFAYLIENPAKDKGCLAKCALVETLEEMTGIGIDYRRPGEWAVAVDEEHAVSGLGIANDFPLARRCKQVLETLNDHAAAQNLAELAAAT